MPLKFDFIASTQYAPDNDQNSKAGKYCSAGTPQRSTTGYNAKGSI
jgi:hypothetical protein